MLLRDLGQRLPRDQRQLFFAWTAKQGPFIEADRQPAPAELDLFVFGEDEIEVTDLGLGEAARRILSSQSACAFSPVEDPTSRFAADPLVVVHGLRDEAEEHVRVPNFLDAAKLAEAIQRDGPDPTNWTEALDQARQRFNRLQIGKHCNESLSGQTFKPHQSRRMNELFEVLQALMEEMGRSGELSAKGQALHSKHFVGKTAWFSDESERNKQRPERYTFQTRLAPARSPAFGTGRSDPTPCGCTSSGRRPIRLAGFGWFTSGRIARSPKGTCRTPAPAMCHHVDIVCWGRRTNADELARPRQVSRQPMAFH